ASAPLTGTDDAGGVFCHADVRVGGLAAATHSAAAALLRDTIVNNAVGGTGRMGRPERRILVPAYPALPADPAPSESQPEPQLELALLEAGGLGEAAEAARRRNRVGRIAERIDHDRRNDALRLLRIEDVLELSYELGPHVAMDWHEARVAQVDVVAVRQVHRVSSDADRPVAVREAVAVQLPAADDVEREAAVELHQD